MGNYGWVSLLVAALTSVGCGGTTDRTPDPHGSAAGGTSTAAPQSVDEFTQRFASSYCQNIAGCCRGQGLATTDCESTLQQQLHAQLQISTTNPRIHFNAEAAGACIEAYAAALRTCTDATAFRHVSDVCDALLQGTVPIGGQCGKGGECAKPATGVVSCTSGVCTLGEAYVSLTDAPHRKLGETCMGTCESSPRETSCGGNPNTDPKAGACWIEDGVVCANGVCVAAPRAGEFCASLSYCEAAAHCVSGTCVADQSSGACTQDNQCLAPTTCDRTLNMCAPLKADGVACDQYSECLGGECYEDHCRKWNIARAHSCLGVLDD